MKTKKELKREYKEMKFPIGVFRIRNILNDKAWIGSSTNLKAVWNSERFQLQMGLHQNKILQKDWKELGADNFVFEIIDELKQSDDDSIDYARDVKSLEKLYVEDLKPYYNSVFNKKNK